MRAASLVPVVERGYERFLSDLRLLVNTDSGSLDRDGVNRVADYCEARLRAAGCEVRRVAHEPGPRERWLGDCVVGTLAGETPRERGGASLMLVGHTDTVFPEGTASDRPFRIEDGRAFGPGVIDMKSGLLTGFHALEALRDCGWGDFARLIFVCNPDEELGSPFSKPIIRELAAGVDACFVLEAARQSGAVVSARKGVSDAVVEVVGRSAHAGVEPEKGRNAVAAAADLVVRLHELNRRWEGVTVNVGRIEGGTRANVVPDRCRLHLEVRSPQVETFGAAKEAVAEIVATPGLGTTATLRWRGTHLPMERAEGTARLVERARAVARELGFELPEAFSGGGSDANTTAAMGVPTLDGLGPVGGAPHSDGEWLDIGSVVPRVALLAGLLSRVSGSDGGNA